MKPEPGRELPHEIYVPLVDSLFKEGRTLVLGILINCGAILATYLKTDHVSLLVCAIAFAVVGGARLVSISIYKALNEPISSNAQARQWEYGYVTGASLSVALLGLWCYATFAFTTDAFSQLISFSMTIGYVIGIFGRNFGSPKFVVVQILCAWLPMTLALFVHGTFYHWFFAVLLVPFFVAVKFISDRLRTTLLDTIIASRDMSEIAERFDCALTNMPQGIFMFDRDGHILVTNGKAMSILGLSSDLDVRGWSVRRLFRSCLRAGSISGEDAKSIADRIGESDTNANDIVVETSDGRTIEFTFQSMDNGGVVAVIQDISERRLAEQTINRMARFDSLTGLPNRSCFSSRLAQAFSKDGPTEHCALHFIDLDNFKQVNDTLGHSRGDMLLQVVAERLQLLLRNVDMPARFGGDEFVVLQSHVQSDTESAALAERIVQEISKPYFIDEVEVVIGASIGIARLPSDGRDPEQLLKSADMALYNAKAAGRGTWRFFEPELEAAARARRSLETDLRRAIERQEFEPFFQPIIDFETGRVRTCEALLRWHHPVRGLVPPGEFIQVAEETGAIAEIGKLVMEKACRECASWDNGVRVAVNISPLQFSLSNVAEVVSEALEISGLEPERLEVEITESALLQNTDAVRDALQHLRRLGVRISLDDFGTGYSSLSYLHSFPLDKVKIDRSFLEGLTRDSRSMTLLCGVARLSAELGLRVTVEGIETLKQLELVTQENFVHEGQGFLFSRPVPANDARQILETDCGHLPGGLPIARPTKKRKSRLLVSDRAKPTAAPAKEPVPAAV